ncbi:MAG: hypothetical protein ACJ781_19005, partial [Myxococcales bacterium]
SDAIRDALPCITLRGETREGRVTWDWTVKVTDLAIVRAPHLARWGIVAKFGRTPSARDIVDERTHRLREAYRALPAPGFGTGVN